MEKDKMENGRMRVGRRGQGKGKRDREKEDG